MANRYLNKTGLSRLVYKIKTLIQDMSKEAYLVWGGKNVAGDVSPVDAAACDDTNANRLAFHPADCIDVEYSTDGGKTWLDYDATDANKTTLVTTSHTFYIGKKSASKATINDKLRITLTAKANHHYWQCQKLLMWISTSGANGCKVLVETRHINEISFSQYGEYNIIGWGGWNSIPLSAYFSAQTNTGHVHKIRLTFTAGSVSGDYNSNLSIGKLRMIAPTCHLNANGELGLNGRIYSLSADKSVTFPNKVTATSFVGATATSTSSGLMSAADKKNLDELPTTKISSSSSSKGVKVSLGGTVGSPTISIETTTNGVAANNSGVVSGAAVKEYVDANKGVSTVFKAQTSSSNAVNGLVPAPTSANTQKYLRGDGTWQTPVSVINNLSSTSTTGALSAAQGKILNEKFGVGVYDLGAFYNYGYSETEPSNGCLIEIGKAASATMVTLQITGFAYYKRKPINSIFVFYDWRNNSGVLEITQHGGINLGYPVGNLMVYHYDGKVYAWIKQTSDFNTLSFKLYSNNSNLSPIVTKSAMHANGVTLLTEIETESPLAASTESSDGLMESTDKKNLNTIKKWYDNIVGVDEDKVINKWDEIVSFLSGIPEGDTLDGLIEAVKTQVGDLKDDIEDGTVIAQESKTLGHETIGSTTKPIYLTSGVAKPCTYTLGTSVPSGAKFTDTNTTYNVVTSSVAGLAPKIGTAAASTIGTQSTEWVLASTNGGTPSWRKLPTNAFNNTTYVAMTGATSTADGKEGLVPKPLYGSENAFLRGDGTWSYRINEFGYTGEINIGTGFSNATGWFRIARARYVRNTPSVFRVAIYRNYSYAVPEAYVFDICTSYHTYDPISITQVSGQASTIDGNKLIDKIRVTRDTSASDSIVYFDFHVNLSKTGNQFFWYVIGSAESYTRSEVVRNPTITSTTESYEFTTVNGFKTNGDIYEGDSTLSKKYANKSDITSGNITAAKATTADSANAIGGKGLNDLVQGGGNIKFIKVVTSLPASPSNDTLYLIKQ